MHIEIPGYKTLDLKYLLLDYNGTIAVDGRLSDSVKELIQEVSKELEIFVLTADTHGTAAALSICIMGEEGCCSHLINETHITVKSIENAFELLLKPKRLIATLRG